MTSQPNDVIGSFARTFTFRENSGENRLTKEAVLLDYETFLEFITTPDERVWPTLSIDAK